MKRFKQKSQPLTRENLMTHFFLPDCVVFAITVRYENGLRE
jgi:hypothetical protein